MQAGKIRPIRKTNSKARAQEERIAYPGGESSRARRKLAGGTREDSKAELLDT
jgi:hypothetical protein